MITGSMVALVTPMDDQGQIHIESLRKLVDFHVDAGTDGLIAVGTTGEAATLSRQEQKTVIQHVTEQAAGRLPVFAGTASSNTAQAVELTAQAKAIGVDGCLIMTPAYVRPTQEGLYQHYAKIAKHVAIPILLYNVPSRTACDLLPTTAAKLSKIANIIGIKDASGDLSRVSQLSQLLDGREFAQYSGNDDNTHDFIAQGGHGTISAVGNIVPELIKLLTDLALSGDTAGAKKIADTLGPLYHHLFAEANPIPVKWLMAKQGLIPPGIRLPLTPLSAEFHDPVLEAYHDVKETLCQEKI